MSDGVVTIARGEGSRIVDPRRVVVRGAGEWQALWAAHAGPAEPAPPVDFASRMVLAVFAGERPAPGHEIHILGTRHEHGRLDVLVEARAPRPEGIAAPVVVTPFHLASVPRTDDPVRFVDPGTPLPAAEAAVDATVADDAPSSTGLDRDVAAALSYLAGPFSGMTILFAERRNRYVRFHAWQSVLGLGGLGLLAFALLVGAFAGLVLSPGIFTALYWLAFATLGVWIVLWVVLLVQAFTGRAWRLPLVGGAAARRAGRV